MSVHKDHGIRRNHGIFCSEGLVFQRGTALPQSQLPCVLRRVGAGERLVTAGGPDEEIVGNMSQQLPPPGGLGCKNEHSKTCFQGKYGVRLRSCRSLTNAYTKLM